MKKTKAKRFKKFVVISMLILGVTIFCGLGAITLGYIATPLNVDALSSTNLGVEIYGDNQTNTTPIYYSSDKKIISASSLNAHTLNAFIAVEDKRFYQHNGYDLKRIVKAGLVNLKSGSKSQGASTITQQLVKNTLLNSEKTYTRKFKEILLAIKAEKNFSKEEILNMYLNTIYFGSNAYGIENASNLYFNKSASELTLNESAILAGIIKSPSYYSPINHPDNCYKRKNIVLKLMLENGYISLDEYENAIALPINVSQTKNSYDNSYNQQAILEACDILNISEKELLRQGLKIYTYLDSNIQTSVANSLTKTDIEADKLSLVADKNGRVLAYLGDSYYDLSRMKRNPASTIKPLIVYLPAIANNLISPATPILDEPLTSDYAPKNAGNNYLGWISVRDALAHSSNVCAVNLLDTVGISTAKQYAQYLGIDIKNEDQSIALGNIGGGIKPIDLAHAYSILQNNGIDHGFTFISRIEDKNGKIIYSHQSPSAKIFNESDCALINDMLITCATSGTAKRLSDLPFQVASKTGTAEINNQNCDLWNIAYTSEHLALTWLGDATSQGLSANYSSGFYPTMINKQIFENIYSSHSPSDFNIPNDIIKVALDKIEYGTNHSLKLAIDNTAERYMFYEIFKSNNIPEEYSTIYNEPTFELNVELTAKGAKLSLNPQSNYVYEVFSCANKLEHSLGQYEKEPIIDDKVFKYTRVEYYAVATNIYDKKQYISEKISITPQEFLVDMLNDAFIAKQQNKTKWYV